MINMIEQKGQVVVSSRQVAYDFGKRHDSVLRDISNLIISLSTTQNCGMLFIESEYTNSNNRLFKEYLLTRDGFTLLAMGFTGQKALEFKLKYIQAFNEMENKIKALAPTSYKEALLLLIAKEEEKEQLLLENKQSQQIIGELKPKADYVDIILNNKGLVTITQIAKDYGMSGQEMNAKLHSLKVQYKQSEQWFLYRDYHGKGYTHSKTIDFKRSDGTMDVKMTTKWTQKGRVFLYNLLKDNKILPVIEQ